MASSLSPLVRDAAQHFRRDGVRPALLAVRGGRPGAPLAERFADDLRDARWPQLPEPPARWHDLPLDAALALLAYCRHRTLAYDTARGAVADHLAAARQLLDALAVRRAWSSSTLHTVIDGASLATPRGGFSYGSNNLLTGATFEQTVLLEGDAFAALVVWTDED